MSGPSAIATPGVAAHTPIAFPRSGAGKTFAMIDSVAGMMKVIESLSLADSGRVIGYDGLDVPW